MKAKYLTYSKLKFHICSYRPCVVEVFSLNYFQSFSTFYIFSSVIFQNVHSIIFEKVSLLGSSLSSSLEILPCRIVHSGCLDVCRKLLDSICMFSLLKRCKYSLYSDTMLNYCPVLNETNEDVHMYIEEFILVDVVTLLYMDEVKIHWKCSSLYTNATIEEKG